MPTQSPSKKLPRRYLSEESAVMQLLIDRLGWRFMNDLPQRDRHPYWMNMNTGKGGIARAFKVIVPSNSALAREFDRITKKRTQIERNTARRARDRKRRARQKAAITHARRQVNR